MSFYHEVICQKKNVLLIKKAIIEALLNRAAMVWFELGVLVDILKIIKTAIVLIQSKTGIPLIKPMITGKRKIPATKKWWKPQSRKIVAERAATVKRTSSISEIKKMSGQGVRAC